jgi:hypothetical protein
MKFANKYELFEAVTNGRVETFFAKDLANGERVLLHIFEAPEKKPDQPTVIWVLESFRKVAPEPPGLVLETGRYSGTTYAYLVTKLPDNASLQRWTQSYDSYVKETQESAIWSEGPPLVSPATSKDVSPRLDRPVESSTPMPSAKPPGDFTAAFSGLPSPVVSPSEANTANPTALDGIVSGSAQTPQREPGEFTKQFFSGFHELPKELAPQAPAKSTRETVAPPKPEIPPNRTGTEAAAKAEATQSQPPKPAPSSGGLTGRSTPPSSRDSGGFTALFRSDFKSETKAASEGVGSPSKSRDAEAGDFTDFFRGPFDGERPAETPAILPKLPDAPQRNAPGEFTRVFGSGKSSDLPAPSPLHSPVGDFSRQDEAGGSTQIFSGVGQPAVAPPANTPSQTWDPVAPKSEVSPLSKEAAWTAPPLRASPPVTPSIEPIPQKASVSGTLREPEPPMPAGATHVFSVVRPPLSSPPPVAGGPSEYTRIISGGMGSNTADKVPIAPPKAAAPTPPKFAPPAAPAAPKAPEMGKAPKPKASYLPLVIILNVLLFLAILLIVYFELKH